MTADELMQEMVTALRKRFFAKVDAKLWAKDLDFVKQAVAYPAAYIEERGLKLPGTRYREILIGIFRDIRAHMQTEPRRPAVYILHAVQKHMDHQGDRYLEEAKQTRTVAQLAPGTVARLKIASNDHLTAAMAEAHAILAGRVQRRCKPAAETQQELFNAPARRTP